MSVSDRKLEEINNKLNRLAETVENNKNTTNTIYKLVEKQDYNSKHSRLWLPGIAVYGLYIVIGQEQMLEQLGMNLLLVTLLLGYWGEGRY